MKSHRRGTAGAAGAAREASALARVAAASSAVGAPAVSPALLGQRVRTQLLLAHIPGVRAIDVPPGERGAAVLAVAASLAQLHALTRTTPSDDVAIGSGTGPDLTGLAALCDAVGLVLPISTTTQTGRAGTWLIPDWSAVAADWDAVHVSVAGYLTTATRALPVADGTAATMLAGWNPDQTWWLTDILATTTPHPAESWHNPEDPDGSDFGWRLASS